MDEELLERVTRRVYKRGLNYVKLKALIRRFMEYNPDGDPETIDWMAVYDDRLEFDELVEAFEKEYPMYRWRQQQPMERKEYEDQIVNHVIEQVEDLSEESIKALINALEERLGVESGAQPAVEPVKTAPITPLQIERTVQTRAPATPQPEEPVETVVQPRVVVDLRLLARYPWLPEAREFLKAFYIDRLPNYVVERAGERVLEALERGELGVSARLDNPVTELLSFPVAKAVVSTVDDPWLKRRWSLAEAARCERLLHTEPQHTFEFLLTRLEIGVERHEDGYRVGFADYLRTAGDLLRDVSWRLISQRLDRGWVYLSRARLTRIVRQRLYTTLYRSFENTPRMTKIPKPLETPISEAVKRLQEIKSRHQPLKPSGRTPPCMETIRGRLAEASHTENFTYAAYLINRGHTVEEVVQAFTVRSDYDERIARYHVEHIAGLRGSRTKYRPPSCRTMKSLGLCIKDGQLCPRNIRNPLEY